MLSRATETTLMRKFSGRAGYITLIIPAFITIALFYILLYSVFLPGFEKNVWLRKREGIREIVYSGWSVLNHYHTLEEKGELTREEAQRQARELIKSMRYGRDFKDYYWITGMDSTLVLHPYRPDLEGKYVLQNTDQSVRNVFITFVDVVKKDGEGFSEYSWQWKDDPGRMEQKLSYVKKFEPWDWIIGSGLYINDVRNDIEAMESRIKRISLFIFSLVLIFISSIIHQNLKANRERLCNVEALLRSEERFRETVDLLPEIVFETDENGTISFVNQFAYFATGYNRLDVEQGFNALDFIEPQDRQRAFANIQSVKEGKVLGVVEYSARRKDGSLFPVLVRSVPIINNGHVTGLRGIIVDITERKQAEKTLAEKEEKYRQLFEMESDAIFLIENATGKISEVNQAASELYGYTRDELRSMKNTNLSAEVSKTIAATLGHEERIPVRMHRKKDGTVFPVEIAARHFILHGKEMHIAAIRDITERIAAKELLEKQWLFLKNVIDNAPNSIYVLDSRCNVVLANKHFAELFGISPEEMIGKNPIDFIRDTTIAKKFRDDEEMIFQGKKPYITIEHTIIDNNGSRRRLYTNKVPLVGASGAVEYLLGISSDITVLLETEEALRKSEDRLGTIFSIATDAIFIKNKSFVYTDVNPAFSTLFNKKHRSVYRKNRLRFF